MPVSSSTNDDGYPVACPVCGHSSVVHVSQPPGDSVCPKCGSFLWVHAVALFGTQYEFRPDVRVPELVAKRKAEAIREMVSAIAVEVDWTDLRADHFCDLVLRREQLGSTGIGRGLAVPHARVEWVSQCVTAIGFAPHGIDFDALDGNPIHTIVLMAAPAAHPEAHLRLLEHISRMMRFLGPPTA